MPIKPPDNPVEDRLIDLLDRRVSLGRQAHELDAIRHLMRQRERAKLAAALQKMEARN